MNLSGRHNITTGKVYQEVIHRERRGDYLGKTVQLVPHASDLVQAWIKVRGRNVYVCVCVCVVVGMVVRLHKNIHTHLL